MSVKNLVQCPLITPVSSTATELILGAVSAPYSLPPLDGGILVIADSPSKPSFVEFIKYTHRIDNVLYGVSRGQEETAARNWTGVTYVYQALTADQYTSELASKEPVIPPGITAQYWRGDKTFQDLGTAVRAANLAGLSLATNTSVAATDTILAALGKLQAQVNARLLATANAVSATKLQTARTLSITGDATGSLSFDGSTNASAALTLASSGVAAGTYKSLTVDAKGRVTAGADVVTGLVTASTATGTANVATSNTNTFLNITEKVGEAVASAGTSTQIQGAGSVTVESDTSGKITITGAQTITGNAATTTKLATARTINGVAFDGTANITVADATKLPLTGGTLTGALNISSAVKSLAITTSGVERGFIEADTYGIRIRSRAADTTVAGSITLGVDGATTVTGNLTVGGTASGNGSGLTTLNASNLASGTIPDACLSGTYTGVSITGNAATATKLATARTIGGVSFDGSANINLPGVNSGGNQSTTGNAATATKLATARTINGTPFDGSANITIKGATQWTNHSANFTAGVGSHNSLLASITVSLPTNAASGDTVEFIKLADVTPVIRTTDGKQIRVKDQADTSVTYNYDARLLAVFNGTAWEI